MSVADVDRGEQLFDRRQALLVLIELVAHEVFHTLVWSIPRYYGQPLRYYVKIPRYYG